MRLISHQGKLVAVATAAVPKFATDAAAPEKIATKIRPVADVVAPEE